MTVIAVIVGMGLICIGLVMANRTRVRHHVWCNYFLHPEGLCRCEQLHREYPEEGRSQREMVKHYYPEVLGLEDAGPGGVPK